MSPERTKMLPLLRPGKKAATGIVYATAIIIIIPAVRTTQEPFPAGPFRLGHSENGFALRRTGATVAGGKSRVRPGEKVAPFPLTRKKDAQLVVRVGLPYATQHDGRGPMIRTGRSRPCGSVRCDVVVVVGGLLLFVRIDHVRLR